MRSNYLSFKNLFKNGVLPSRKKDEKYSNPELTYENAVFHHSPMRLFENVEQAVGELNAPRDASTTSNILFIATANKPLKCKFRLLDSPTKVHTFEKALVKHYGVSDFEKNSPMFKWQTVEIPSVWQLHPNKIEETIESTEDTLETDNDDPPIYTNIIYPWKAKNNASTVVPVENNPTGVYRVEFEVPENWLDNSKKIKENHEIRLLFQGGGSGLAIYLNGTYLGYGQDSMTETEVVVPLETIFVENVNILTVFCHKYTDGSYLEDQDQWWFTGLFRDIELQLVPCKPIALLDYKVSWKTPQQLSTWNSKTTNNAEITTSFLFSSDYFDEKTVEEIMPEAQPGLANFEGLTNVNETDDAATLENEEVKSEDLTEKPFSVLVHVFTPDQVKVGEKLISLDISDEKLESTSIKQQKRLRVTIDVPDAKLWSVQDPHLYTVVYELRHKTEDQEMLLQCEGLKVGIRSVDVLNGQVRVNCAPILVCGVNRHEFCPQKGKVMTEELLRSDLRLIKNLNFNAVRCSHYPNVHRFYELCNEFGLFVVDEANVETHGMSLAHSMSSLQLDKRFQKQIQRRIKSMYLRSKNYSCIIGWSLGNEAGSGVHLRSVVDWLRTEEEYFEKNVHLLNDPQSATHELYRGRFIQYEGGVASGDSPLFTGDGQDPHLTDIICPMYFTPHQMLETLIKDNKRVKALKSKLSKPNLKKWKSEMTKRHKAKFRPFILCEYAHAMGNSSGNLHLYWKLFKSATYPQFQGGFIWDFVDQGVSLVNANIDFTKIYPELEGQSENGAQKFGYGGSFGPRSGVADANFCINGLVLPNRDLKPGVREAKYLQQPIDFDVQVDLEMNSCFHLKAHVHSHCLALEQLSFEWGLFDQTQSTPIASSPFDLSSSKQDGEGLLVDLPKAFMAFKDALIDCRRGGKSDQFSLEIIASVANETNVFSEGHVLARELFNLETVVAEADVLKEESFEIEKAENVDGTDEFSSEFNETDRSFTIETSVYSAKFDSVNGVLMSLNTKSDGSVIEEKLPGINYCFYRAPTDNDNGGPDTLVNSFIVKLVSKMQPAKLQALSSPWKKLDLASMTAKVVSVNVEEEAGFLKISVIERHSSKKQLRFKTTTEYIFLPQRLSMKFKVTAAKSIAALRCLPRVGVSFSLPGSYKSCTYLGRGPDETYPDRKAANGFKVHAGELRNWRVPYVKPSESGGRSDVKWVDFHANQKKPSFRLTYSDGQEGNGTLLSRPEVFPGFKADGQETEQQDVLLSQLENPVADDVEFKGKAEARPAGMNGCQFSISSHSPQEIAASKHDFDLPKKSDNDSFFIHIDAAHMGVGGDTSWFPHLHDQYRVKGKEWQWQLEFEPKRQD